MDKRKRWLAYVFVCIGLAHTILSTIHLWMSFPISTRKNLLIYQPDGAKPGYVLSTDGCTIPDIDPFDERIKRYIRLTNMMPIRCNATPPLTYLDKDYIRINRTALKIFYGNHLTTCDCTTILRPPPERRSDGSIYSKGNITFRSDLRIASEFVRVACYGKRRKLIYVNFHFLILRKPEVEKRCTEHIDAMKNSGKWGNRDIMNVLIIGVDSVSRLNYMRQMNNTRKYVNEHLGAVEMQAYHKVADNTFVNMVPLLSGKYAQELPWDINTMRRHPFDEYNFIWNNFSKNGYRTLCAEDAPGMAIFHYLKAGFFHKPVDYYMRPFNIAMSRYKPVWNSKYLCMGTRIETEIVLDYLNRFIQEFKRGPYFGLSFTSKVTHGSVNDAGKVDPIYLKFFKNLKRNGHLNNTVVFFLSDHGMRFGSMRTTYVGQLEERLPFLSIILPPWFHQKYPRASKNLYMNRHRLTTPFDVYATIEHILKLSGDVTESTSFNRRSISLFKRISLKRSCESASILPHWCTCHNKMKMSVNDPIVRKATNTVIVEINNLLHKVVDKCEVLKLIKITKAFRSVEHSSKLSLKEAASLAKGRKPSHGKEYRIQFMTSPGRSMFESTVSEDYNSGNMTISGSISRINKYGNQSACVKQFVLRKYCFCKK